MAAVMLFLRQTTGKTERHTHFCISLEPVFTRDCGGRVHFTDEPTGALNSANTENVLNVLSSLHEKGQTIVMVTHDIRSARRAERIKYLQDGVITGELELGNYVTGDVARHEKLRLFLKEMGW